MGCPMCQKMTREELAKNRRVVVSNTFTMLREIEPNRSMTKNLRIIQAPGKLENNHGVSPEVLQRMAERCETLPAH